MPQSAFIYNATVRENILFGQPYDEAKYQRALEAASLGPDLAILPGAVMLPDIALLLIFEFYKSGKHHAMRSRSWTEHSTQAPHF